MLLEQGVLGEVLMLQTLHYKVVLEVPLVLIKLVVEVLLVIQFPLFVHLEVMAHPHLQVLDYVDQVEEVVVVVLVVPLQMVKQVVKEDNLAAEVEEVVMQQV
jgi:hypothetical protein